MTAYRRTPVDWQRRFAAVAVALMASALSFPASGETNRTPEEMRERFQLFAKCRPLSLDVVYGNTAAPNDDYTRSVIRAAAESRLRSARIYNELSPYTLNVQVLVLGNFAEFSVGFKKYVHDHMSGYWRFVTTWEVRTLSPDFGDLTDVLSDMSRHLDRFLADYLRVNEEACN